MSDLIITLVQALQAQAAKNRGFLSDAMARALASVAIETIREYQRGGAASENDDQGEAHQEAWDATGELRWFTDQPNQPVRLQQAFRRPGETGVEWRDVPLVVAQTGP